MSYTATKTNNKPSDKYSRLRTVVGVQEQLLKGREDKIHGFYEQRLNEQLQDALQRNIAHLQAQVDAEFARATVEVDKANAEAKHWREQVEIIYSLLDDTTEKAEAEIARLNAVIAELRAGQLKVRSKKAQGKPKPKQTNPRREVEE